MKNFQFLIFTAMLIFALSAFAGVGKMDNYFVQRVNDFKMKEGLDKFHPAPDAQGVAADWSGLSQWPVISSNQWVEETKPEAFLSESGVEKAYYYTRGKETLHLKIWVSSAGNAATLQKLLDMAVFVTSMTIPYKRADGPGDVGLISINPNVKDKLWIYRNVLFHIDYNGEDGADGPFDTLTLAKDIQKYTEAHLVKNIQNHYPRIARVVVAPEKVHAGDDFTVTLKMEGDTDAGRYGMDFNRSDNLELESIDEGLSIRLQALAPGKGEVCFRVYDVRTLLMTQKTIRVDIREKGK